jgi:hypothetical protein
MKQKIKRHSLDIELLKSQLLTLNSTIQTLYKTLQAIEPDNSIIYLKNRGKITTTNNLIVNNTSIYNELMLYINDQHANNSSPHKITNLYKHFADYLQTKHNIILKEHVTPQKLGLLVRSIDTTNLLYTITRKRSASCSFYIIQTKYINQTRQH